MSTSRASLRDEIELRQASISDARIEHAAGELDDRELDALISREESAIALCRERLLSLETTGEAEAPEVRDAGTRSPRRHRRSLLITSLVCFALAIIVLLVTILVPRQPGESDTGSISGATSQRITRLLSQAEIDQALSNSTAAVAAYNQVLGLDANNVEALAQSGWIYFSAGSSSSKLTLIREGESRVRRAVQLAPKAAGPRLYYAIIAGSTPGERQLAIAQLRIFLTLKPSAVLLQSAKPWLTKYGLALR